MPHVLLIRPLCEGDEPEFAEPLGIERLAGYLREADAARVTLMDRRLYQRERRVGIACGSFWPDVRAACETEPPDVVGLSLMTAADVPDALRIISRVRVLWPQAQLVAGGLYVTTNPEGARRRLPSAVTLLTGEGEAALLSVVQGVNGFHTADAPVTLGNDAGLLQGGVASTEHAEPLTPDDWAKAYRPSLERYAALGCAVNMQTSRGCPGRCTFCATPSLEPHLRRWQPRNLNLVIDEIEAEAARLAHAGLPPVFNFVDDDFGPLSRVESLVYELQHRKLRVAFALEMRLAALIGQPCLAERLAGLHQAGLTRVFFGVESLNAETLRRWHKPYNVQALPEVLSACAQAGITVQAGYILWHQHQSVQGALSEVESLARLGIYTHRAALSRLIVFPGCELAQGARSSAVPPEDASHHVGSTAYSERLKAQKSNGIHAQDAQPNDTNLLGFQHMAARSEAFYRQFCERTASLTTAWTEAAIAEPYAAAQAFLTGDATRLDASRQTLRHINEQSLETFRQLACEEMPS